MASFDVKSLFTKVPVDETLKNVIERLLNDDSLEEKTTLTTKSLLDLQVLYALHIFCLQQHNVSPSKGAPMGSL